MAKVLLAGRLHAAGLALLEARPDVSYEMLDSPSAQDIDAHIADVDGIVLRLAPLRAATIAKASRLKVVARHGVGFDNVDLPALTERRIPVAIVGDVNAAPVAEHTLALMLAVIRQVPVYDREMRHGNYAIRESLGATELADKTVLVVGFGRIGTRVAKLCAAFDMHVIVADPYVPRGKVEERGYRYVEDFRDVLARADIVTLHLPGQPDGDHIIGTDEFARMRRGVCLINCARGTLVDEDALVNALQIGKVRGAGLDVTREEPTPEDHPLLKLDNVVLSPHCAGVTAECFARMAEVCVRNVLDAIDGKLDPDLVVNREALGKPGATVHGVSSNE